MNTGSKRVLFFQSDLHGGGAERNVLNLVNGLDRARYTPTLVLNQAKGSYVDDVRDDVAMVELGAPRLRSAFWSLARELRRQRPDVVISTLQGPSFMLWLARALTRSKARLVICESNNWTARGVSPRSLVQRLIALAYRGADRVVCPVDGINDDVILRHGRVRTQTIANPVDVAGICQAADADASARPAWAPAGERTNVELVAAGRLTRQKGFDLLVDAVGSIQDLPWRLTILGEGPDEASLVAQARALGIADRVAFPGFVADPYPWFAEADLFVLSSRWEGFGHVIAEAMALGTPVLSTRCPSGPDEIIDDGVDGVLCAPDSADAIAASLRGLIADATLRTTLGERARESVMRFDVGPVVAAYEALFDELLATT